MQTVSSRCLHPYSPESLTFSFSIAQISPDSHDLQVELDMVKFAENSCSNITRLPDDIIAPATKQYCCSSTGKLPETSLGTVCNSKLFGDINAYLQQPEVSLALKNGEAIPPTNAGASEANARELCCTAPKGLADKSDMEGF